MQVFPRTLLPSTYYDPDNTLQARSEVERREKYFALIESHTVPPTLIDLVQQCLHNALEHRPSTNDLVDRLRRIKMEMKTEDRDSFRLDLQRVSLAKELKAKKKMIAELSTQKRVLHSNYHQYTRNSKLPNVIAFSA